MDDTETHDRGTSPVTGHGLRHARSPPSLSLFPSRPQLRLRFSCPGSCRASFPLRASFFLPLCQFLAGTPVVLVGWRGGTCLLPRTRCRVRRSQDRGNCPGLLWLERGDGDFGDLPVLSAPGTGTPVAGVAGAHVHVGTWTEELVGRLTGRCGALTAPVPARPVVDSFFGEKVNAVRCTTHRTSSRRLFLSVIRGFLCWWRASARQGLSRTSSNSDI